ncbi:unnamed protein product [Schistosoma curassoni]|uniref:CTD small phosphatase-like protein 2 n=1 Tax=Schistosoma curassoni TaxID=6186 RepID=A0A183KZP1_9TREM|nr:unnamed protein product [Schistosoma curassoni]VDP72558.1 unnamed protein product [Schistosoma curassoni]
MPAEEGRIARKSTVSKQNRKQVRSVLKSEKVLHRSTRKQVVEVITPPISARLRSAGTRQTFEETNVKLDNLLLKPKGRKSVAHVDQIKQNGTHLALIVESNGIPDVLNNHSPSTGSSQNGTENKVSETPVLQPMTSSRFCSTM